MKMISNNKGFSLIELLAVVAIIGILAVIGIPQYNKFKIKAFQAEAKAQLATVYAAEHAFFTEYNGYHSSLKVIGYAPHGRARYNVGFGAPGTTPPTAPPESNFLNSKAICSGTFGEGTDPNCEMMVDVPAIDIASTVDSTSYQVSALAYEDLLVVKNESPSSSVIARVIIGALAQADTMGNGLTEDSSMVDAWHMNQLNVLSHQKTLYDCLRSGTCVHR